MHFCIVLENKKNKSKIRNKPYLFAHFLHLIAFSHIRYLGFTQDENQQGGITSG